MNLQGLSKFEADKKLAKRIEVLMMEWHRAYPNVDLKEQLQWAHAWLITSGKRYQDMGRFLNNWFRRCQKDFNANRSFVPKYHTYQETRPKEDDVLSGDDISKMKEVIRGSKRTIA